MKSHPSAFEQLEELGIQKIDHFENSRLDLSPQSRLDAVKKAAAKKPAPSNQETQRVEKLKAKYLRANIRNYSHKL